MLAQRRGAKKFKNQRIIWWSHYKYILPARVARIQNKTQAISVKYTRAYYVTRTRKRKLLLKANYDRFIARRRDLKKRRKFQ